jgi:hypothetical protein
VFVKGQGVRLCFINHGVVFRLASRWRGLRVVDIVDASTQGFEISLQATENTIKINPQA